MPKDDVIDLLLNLVRKQDTVQDTQDDILLHVLKYGDEAVTITDTLLTLEKKDHPVKWGDGTKWGFATWA